MTDQDYQETDDEVVTDGGCPAETASQSPFILEDDRRTATFSDDREYRYRLSRTWDASKPTCAFVMLNPSTADASELDPTCRRCKGYAEDWGFGSLIVGNIFALRATDPDELYTHDDPVGPKNDEFLQEIVSEADLVVAAWGTYGEHMDRGREVARTLNVNWHCLDTTQGGQPNHPLYKNADLKPKPWDASQLFVSTDGGVDLEQDRGELVADGGTEASGVERGPAIDIPLGPHRIPRVSCSTCGEEHHPDYARHHEDEYTPQCRECRAYLRRPTPMEEEEFTWFIVWNGAHLDREEGRGKYASDGGTATTEVDRQGGRSR